MRAVLSLLVLVSLVMVSFATIAAASERPPVDPTQPVVPSARLRAPGNALLQLSPMYVEIRDSLTLADEKQKQLLADLAVAPDEPAADAIVHQLESLPLETLLTILRIQLRYAHDQDRVELERQIQLRMLELEANGRI